MSDGACAACGSPDLRAHMRVAGEAGAMDLAPTTDRFGTALADIVRCGSCGHMQLERFPDDAELAEAYARSWSEDYVGEEAGQRATARAVLERLERHVPRGRLLDLGSWVGFLLAEARDRGWEVQGVEPSGVASAFARDRLGVEVVTADLLAAELPPGSFQAVVLGDVIEHLPRPGEALDRIAALLAPGGAVCMMLPDAGSRLARLMGPRWWSVIPTHVQYFTRASMRTLLARHDYGVLEMGTQPKFFTVRYYLGRIEGYSPAVGRLLVALARRGGIADRQWGPDFRDRMLVIARPGQAQGARYRRP
jgi:SAM-dependent methyltransferase